MPCSSVDKSPIFGTLVSRNTYGYCSLPKFKPWSFLFARHIFFAVDTTASRRRLNFVGAITLDAIEKAIVSSYETVNAETIIKHFEIIREKNNSKGVIHIILAQAGYHRSELVREKSKNLNMKLHYLPPYSPNLNPIERLWKVMNEQVSNNRFFKNSKDFRDSIHKFFKETLPQIGQSLKSRINDNFSAINI